MLHGCSRCKPGVQLWEMMTMASPASAILHYAMEKMMAALPLYKQRSQKPEGREWTLLVEAGLAKCHDFCSRSPPSALIRTPSLHVLEHANLTFLPASPS